MNFVNYCLYTKNFSALKAMNEYTKVFGILDSLKSAGNKIKKGVKKAGDSVTKNLTGYSQAELNGLHKRGGMSNLDILKDRFKNKGEKNELIIDSIQRASKNLRDLKDTDQYNENVTSRKGVQKLLDKRVNSLNKVLRDVGTDKNGVKYDMRTRSNVNDLLVKNRLLDKLARNKKSKALLSENK